jgi:hypothetical protein
VVGIVPTEAALVGLAGSVPIDGRGGIAAERRSFFEGSMAEPFPESDDAEAATAEFERHGGRHRGSHPQIPTTPWDAA